MHGLEVVLGISAVIFAFGWGLARPQRGRRHAIRRQRYGAGYVRRAQRVPSDRFATPEQRQMLLRLYEGKCAAPWCRRPLGSHFEVDHIRPYSWGGKTELSNLRPLHPACHKVYTRMEFPGRWR